MYEADFALHTTTNTNLPSTLQLARGQYSIRDARPWRRPAEPGVSILLWRDDDASNFYLLYAFPFFCWLYWFFLELPSFQQPSFFLLALIHPAPEALPSRPALTFLLLHV